MTKLAIALSLFDGCLAHRSGIVELSEVTRNMLQFGSVSEGQEYSPTDTDHMDNYIEDGKIL